MALILIITMSLFPLFFVTAVDVSLFFASTVLESPLIHNTFVLFKFKISTFGLTQAAKSTVVNTVCFDLETYSV